MVGCRISVSRSEAAINALMVVCIIPAFRKPNDVAVATQTSDGCYAGTEHVNLPQLYQSHVQPNNRTNFKHPTTDTLRNHTVTAQTASSVDTGPTVTSHHMETKRSTGSGAQALRRGTGTGATFTALSDTASTGSVSSGAIGTVSRTSVSASLEGITAPVSVTAVKSPTLTGTPSPLSTWS